MLSWRSGAPSGRRSFEKTVFFFDVKKKNNSSVSLHISFVVIVLLLQHACILKGPIQNSLRNSTAAAVGGAVEEEREARDLFFSTVLFLLLFLLFQDPKSPPHRGSRQRSATGGSDPHRRSKRVELYIGDSKSKSSSSSGFFASSSFLLFRSSSRIREHFPHGGGGEQSRFFGEVGDEYRWKERGGSVVTSSRPRPREDLFCFEFLERVKSELFGFPLVNSLSLSLEEAPTHRLPPAFKVRCDTLFKGETFRKREKSRVEKESEIFSSEFSSDQLDRPEKRKKRRTFSALTHGIRSKYGIRLLQRAQDVVISAPSEPYRDL